MSKFAIQKRKTTGEYGLFVIEETGFCGSGDAAAIEAGCTRRFKLVPLPNAAGAIMKVLDGTAAQIVSVAMLTDGQTYNCVKIHGETQAHAPTQPALGDLASGAVLLYRIVYQQVGGLV